MATDYEKRLKKARKLVARMDDDDRWALKQALAGPSRYYGDGGTIHASTRLDVELAPDGTIVDVWFRCMTLPFGTWRRDLPMDSPDRYAQEGGPGSAIHGIEVVDPPQAERS